jgi:transcriptional regulator with PAS, ATPase and Fis domain
VHDGSEVRDLGLGFPACRPSAQGGTGAGREGSFIAGCGGSPDTEGVRGSSRWELQDFDGGDRWRFRRALEGFDIELELDLIGKGREFLNRRLNAAAPLLDFLEVLLLERAIECAEFPNCTNDDKPLDPPLIYVSAEIRELVRNVRLFADSSVPVLIEGESGTGKEIIARNIHHLSSRRMRPLVIVNCMEMPASLLQSELFGHIKGSFTGASRDRMGLIESAGSGTFFLDEIGEMPMPLQATLLRVLQEREVRRIGESARRKVDVRFVFATNRDLRELVLEGKFREDLYYRVSGASISIPPLRERREDIIPLARYFLHGCAAAEDRYLRRFSLGTVKSLLSYPWPGNVRELKNEMERMSALHRGSRKIVPEMLSASIRESERGRGSIAGSGNLPDAVNRLERSMIAEALERHANNRTRAAAELGITRQGLLKKIKRFGMNGFA